MANSRARAKCTWMQYSVFYMRQGERHCFESMCDTLRGARRYVQHLRRHGYTNTEIWRYDRSDVSDYQEQVE